MFTSEGGRRSAAAADGRDRGDVTRRARWQFLGLAVAAALAGMVYANSVGGEFVWDDRKLIVDDSVIKSWSHLGDIFSHDFFERNEDDLPYGYYRPLTTLSYLLDYSAWGLRPFGYHLTNVLLHCACTLLVGLVLLRLGWPPGGAVIAALLFAVHPLHTENVAWVAGRTDLLAFFFSAAALLLYLAAGPDDRRNVGQRTSIHTGPLLRRLAVLLFALGLLAKEMAVVLIGWLVLIHLIVDRDDWRRSVRAVVPYLIVVAAYAVWRFVLINVPLPGSSEHHRPVAVILSTGALVVRYLGWLALPIDLNAYVQNPYVVSPTDPRFLGALLVLGGATWFAYRFGSRAPRALLAAAMLALSFLPILNFIRVAAPADMGDVMAERFCYFPSFPFVALVGLGAAALIERARARPLWSVAAATAFGLLLALAAVTTVRRNRAWHDEYTFLTTTLNQSPTAVLLWSDLATYHLRRHQLDDGQRALDRAAAIDPENYWVRSARALWYVVSGRHAEAIPIQRSIAAEAKHGHGAALNNLAYLYRVTGQDDQALAILDGLVADGSAYADVYFNLAEIHRQHNRLDEARHYYRRAFEERPDNRQIATAWAAFELEAGDPEEAERIDRALLALYPDDPRVLNNLGLIRHRVGDTSGAVEILRRVVARQPDYINARINYAQLLHDTGRTDEAVAQLERARQLAAGTALEADVTKDLEEMKTGGPEQAAPTGKDGDPTEGSDTGVADDG